LLQVLGERGGAQRIPSSVTSSSAAAAAAVTELLVAAVDNDDDYATKRCHSLAENVVSWELP